MPSREWYCESHTEEWCSPTWRGGVKSSHLEGWCKESHLEVWCKESHLEVWVIESLLVMIFTQRGGVMSPT